MSNKHRGQRKGYRPSFEDFFPTTPRGETRRGAKEGPDRDSNIQAWREERGLAKPKAPEFSIALKEAA